MKMRLRWLVLCGAAMVLAQLVQAHEVRPAYLELTQTDREHWSVLWKVPAQGDMRLSIRPWFPPTCVAAAEPIAFQDNGAHVERTAISCRGGLVGRALGVNGLAATQTDVLVRSVRSDGAVQTVRLSPASPDFVFDATPGSLEVACTYALLGVEHILLGIDHLLFVLGLLLIVRDKWVLVKTITAFTIAHSITLAAATLGWLRVSQPPVEAVIALSILFLASELVKQEHGQAGLMQRYPWFVAFTFGLLHGLGFAGALRAVGLPDADIPLALFTFNIGVEIGQLSFVTVVLLAISVLRHSLVRMPTWTRVLPGYVIGTMATFWWLQRMALLL